MSRVDNSDLNNLLNSAIEAKPEFVKPPPLQPIGQPRLGWKPKSVGSKIYKDFNGFLLIVVAVGLMMLGFVVGYLYATSIIS